MLASARCAVVIDQPHRFACQLLSQFLWVGNCCGSVSRCVRQPCGKCDPAAKADLPVLWKWSGFYLYFRNNCQPKGIRFSRRITFATWLPNTPRYVWSSSMTIYLRFSNKLTHFVWCGRMAECSISGFVMTIWPAFLTFCLIAGDVSPSYVKVLQSIAQDETNRALYLFPTKALAQDQKSELNEIIDEMGIDIKSFTYDGDTSPAIRQKVRKAGLWSCASALVGNKYNARFVSSWAMDCRTGRL